jgi:hypothetical protein
MAQIAIFQSLPRSIAIATQPTSVPTSDYRKEKRPKPTRDDDVSEPTIHSTNPDPTQTQAQAPSKPGNATCVIPMNPYTHTLSTTVHKHPMDICRAKRKRKQQRVEEEGAIANYCNQAKSRREKIITITSEDVVDRRGS